MTTSISPQRRDEVIDALRRGTVPRSSLDAFAVGLDRFEAALEDELRKVAAGGSVFKAVRGDYGCGKTFFARWLADRARKLGLRQLIDEVDSGRFPGLYLLITGTPASYDGPQGAHRLEPLAQRLHVDFQTEARFDNPRAVQMRLAGFNLERLCQVGCKVRDIFQHHSQAPERIAAACDDSYVRGLAEAVTGKLGGKVGVAPRIFLKKLVADILDRVDQFPDFNPRQHYALTIAETELTPVERQAMGATDVDQIELDL